MSRFRKSSASNLWDNMFVINPGSKIRVATYLAVSINSDFSTYIAVTTMIHIYIFGADMSQSFLRKVLLTDNVRWHSDWVNFCLLWRSKLILKYELIHFGVTEWHAILVQKSELLHIWRSHLTRISQPKLLSLLSDSLWFIYIFGADMGDWSPASTGIDCSSSKLFLNVMRWCDCPCRI